MVYNQQMPMQPMQPYNQGVMQPMPYQDRMSQLQNYNQNLQAQFPAMQNAGQAQTVGLNGKVIQVVENITANDVPMDGSIALFPMQDMSQILAKAWQSDGTIRTVVYKPVLEEQPNNSPQADEKVKFDAFNEVLEGISAKVDTLTNRFDEFIGKSKTNVRTKKEVETD